MQVRFAEYYRKRLSRRLLIEKSSAEHHERGVLVQLKQQCGAQFTSKVRAPCSNSVRRGTTVIMSCWGVLAAGDICARCKSPTASSQSVQGVASNRAVQQQHAASCTLSAIMIIC